MISYSALLHHTTVRCLPEWAWLLEWEIWEVSDCCYCWVWNICNEVKQVTKYQVRFYFWGKIMKYHISLLIKAYLVSSTYLCLSWWSIQINVWRQDSHAKKFSWDQWQTTIVWRFLVIIVFSSGDLIKPIWPVLFPCVCVRIQITEYINEYFIIVKKESLGDPFGDILKGNVW